MSETPSVHVTIEQLVKGNDVVLFMKGERQMPQCGFSATVVQILDEFLDDYATVNVLSDPAIRQGIKEFSQWPTIPQLYVRGEFVGGCDIIRDMFSTGALADTLGIKLEDVPPPTIKVSASAQAAIRQAMQEHAAEAKETALRLEVTPRYEHGLTFATPGPQDVVVELDGLTLVMDRSSARRADGLSIDFIEGPTGSGFKIENPNGPPSVKEIRPQELKSRLDAQEALKVYDVRTADERAIAALPDVPIFDDAARAEIEALDKDTVLVFHCHHGGRSQAVAQSFAQQGFRNCYNLVGGIDAWSRDVDASVPRY